MNTKFSPVAEGGYSGIVVALVADPVLMQKYAWSRESLLWSAIYDVISPKHP